MEHHRHYVRKGVILKIGRTSKYVYIIFSSLLVFNLGKNNVVSTSGIYLVADGSQFQSVKNRRRIITSWVVEYVIHLYDIYTYVGKKRIDIYKLYYLRV